MKKAIAMKCTQENWDSIKYRIPKEMINSVTSFEKYEYLINFYSKNKISNISKTNTWSYFWDKKPAIHETFNAKIFLEACGIDYESEYIITKLQLTQLLKNNEEGNEQLVSADLRAWFPDAFKKELEYGKWYKSGYGAIVFCESFTSNNNIQGYGFNSRKEYVQSTNWFEIDKWKEATPQEVESALICEAKKRGYKDGDLIYSKWAGGCTLNHKEPYLKNNELWFGDCRIFVDGIWAEIAEKMTISQIEKELGRKIELI